MGDIHNQDQYLTDGAEIKAADGTTLVGQDGVEAIADGAVDTDALADNAVESSDIKDGAVGTADLAASLDFSGKTLTFAAASIPGSVLLYPKLDGLSQTVTFDQFTDGGGAVGTFDLSGVVPDKSLFIQALVTDVTRFVGDTSAVLTIGDGTDVDRYNTGTIDVFSTVSNVAAGAPSGTAVHTADETVTLTVTTAADFTSVSAGSVKVTLFFYAV